jgi:hypothetical protein
VKKFNWQCVCKLWIIGFIVSEYWVRGNAIHIQAQNGNYSFAILAVGLMQLISMLERRK